MGNIRSVKNNTLENSQLKKIIMSKLNSDIGWLAHNPLRPCGTLSATREPPHLGLPPRACVSVQNYVPGRWEKERQHSKFFKKSNILNLRQVLCSAPFLLYLWCWKVLFCNNGDSRRWFVLGLCHCLVLLLREIWNLQPHADPPNSEGIFWCPLSLQLSQNKTVLGWWGEGGSSSY